MCTLNNASYVIVVCVHVLMPLTIRTSLMSVLCVSAADDDVYLEEEEDRKEYVLNGSGRIWGGTSKSPFARKWEFEQVCLRLPGLTHLTHYCACHLCTLTA